MHVYALYVHVYNYVCTCMNNYVCVYECTCKYIVCVYACVCMYVCMYNLYVCIYIMYVYVCVYACEYLYMYACMYTLCTLTTGMFPITYHSM